MSVTEGQRTVRVWDLPTRLFHWLLVLLVVIGLFTGFITPEWWMGVHSWAGYGVVALIVFRLVWGVFGPEYSRLVSLAYGPRHVLDYLRGLLFLRPRHYIGHNPAGAMMILLLFAMLTGITISGLLVLGGEEKQGPLAGIVPYDIGHGAKEIHETLVNILMVLVGLHVTAVLAHNFVGRENLVKAMITGRKVLPPGTQLPAPRPARPGLALASLAAILGLAGLTLVELNRLPPLGVRAHSPDPAYLAECGSCHEAYHPSLLPAASWQALMGDLGNHFGEDANLDPARKKSIAAWLAANAAETWDTEAASRFRASASDTPLRITVIPYWRQRHSEIPDSVFARNGIRSKAHCSACHGDAASGRFDDQAISIPPN